MKKQGFTLIELLIVIALLGALAVGLLAALDPFEQLKKGNDTGVRNTVAEIHGAVIRYYAVRSAMPYGSSVTATEASTGYGTIGLDDVVNAGELKSDFKELAGKKLTSITAMGTTTSFTVCFQPESRSFRSDQNTKYTIDGSNNFNAATNDFSTCGLPSQSNFSCYWCVK